MPISSAERQKTYRKRKRKADFFAYDYCYQRLVIQLATWDSKDELLAILRDAYDLADGKAGISKGAELVRRLSTLLIEFVSVKNALDAGEVKTHD